MQVLAAHRILSAPVVSDESNDAEHKETAEPHDFIKDVAGFIDIRDILSSFLQGMFVTNNDCSYTLCTSIVNVFYSLNIP